LLDFQSGGHDIDLAKEGRAIFDNTIFVMFGDPYPDRQYRLHEPASIIGLKSNNVPLLIYAPKTLATTASFDERSGLPDLC